MNLYRIHIRPKGGTADIPTTFKYCLRQNILGVGWRTDSNSNTTNWDEYFREASKIYDDLNVCTYIHKWLREDDLVWTRDGAGEYYLARAVSGWEYWTSREAAEKDIDIANIFRVIFKPVPIDLVPGKVVACFRASRTIQGIADDKAIEYSKYLWNTLSNESVYQVDRSGFSDIFMMLDDEETEDLVFLYLQSQGWYVVPNSRKKDTMRFEYLTVNPKTAKRALSQVKTGNTVINREDYADRDETVFLFQSNDLFTGRTPHNVTCIFRDEILRFLYASLEWLPGHFRKRVELIEG